MIQKSELECTDFEIQIHFHVYFVTYGRLLPLVVAFEQRQWTNLIVNRIVIGNIPTID